MRIVPFQVLLALALATACRDDGRERIETGETPTLAQTRRGTVAPPPAPVAVLPSGRSIPEIAAAVMPSVVTVHSARSVTASPIVGRFDDFFGPPGGPAPRFQVRGLGSGVIVAADGVIVTNNHVVAGAEQVHVALHDGRELDARVVGADPLSDLAILRVDAKDLPAMEMGDSSKLRAGDLVLAVGNPFGIGPAVTMGIISATGRASVGIIDYEDFLQTDAAINPGNSGGALVDANGRLVGINTAIASRSGGYQGVGFAIPTAMMVPIKDAILRDGKVVRGWLGVAIQDVDRELADALDLGVDRGALVSDVSPAAPAAQAGLQRGDVVTAIDGVEVRDSAQLRNRVAMTGPGEHVTLEVRRGDQTLAIEATLGELPVRASPTSRVPGGPSPGPPLAGIEVTDLDANLRARLRLPAGATGVVVTDVAANSAAAAIGLQPGDLIVEVERTPVDSAAAFLEAASAAKGAVALLVRRGDATRYVVLPAPP
jgi:serine protease Do